MNERELQLLAQGWVIPPENPWRPNPRTTFLLPPPPTPKSPNPQPTTQNNTQKQPNPNEKENTPCGCVLHRSAGKVYPPKHQNKHARKATIAPKGLDHYTPKRHLAIAQTDLHILSIHLGLTNTQIANLLTIRPTQLEHHHLLTEPTIIKWAIHLGLSTRWFHPERPPWRYPTIQHAITHGTCTWCHGQAKYQTHLDTQQ